MKNVARLPENDRRELFRNTADKMGLNDTIIEKDFWYALLWIIFSTDAIGRTLLLSKVEQVFPRHSI